MRCYRCDNMMFPVTLQDFGGGLMNQDAQAWRCFACGEIVDPLIHENRIRGRDGENEWPTRGARHRIAGIGVLR